MSGATRPKHAVRLLGAFAAFAIVLAGFVSVWLPGADAQDGTNFAGTAVAEFTPTEFIEPTPTPSPAPVNYDAPEFVDGVFRIVVQRADWAPEIADLGLGNRTGRDWVAVIADVINFSDIATAVTPNNFSLRTAGNPLGGFAKTTTEQTAANLNLQPTDAEEDVLLQPGESERFVLVFQVDKGVRDPALVYQANAIPLESRISQNLGFDDLPEVAEAPGLTPAVLTSVVNGNTVEVTGEVNGPLDMTGVDAPLDNDCFADEATARLETIIGANVLIEQPGNGQAGVYLWVTLDTGARVLLNQDMVITGHATTNAKPGGRFTDWLNDSLYVAKLRTAGLWGQCTSPHGADRPDTIERETFETAINGGDTGPYIPWVQWTPLILGLPNGGAIAFYSAEAEPENPATPTPSEELERRLYFTVYDEETGEWSVAEPLPGGGKLQFGVAGVVDSIGRVHIVYSDRQADTPAAVSTLKYMVRELNGAWSRPENVAPNSLAGHQIAPSLAIDSDDTLYVVWQDQRLFDTEAREESPSNADAFYAKKVEGEDWTSAVSINAHSDEELVSRPLVAVDGDRVIAVWSIYNLDNLNSANRIDWSYLEIGDETEWEEPLTMIAGRGEAFGGRLLDLKTDPTGGVIFVFGRQSSDTFLFMRRLPALSTEWEPDILLTYGDRGSFPALTVAPDGTAYIVYNLGGGDEVDVAGVAVLPNSITPGPEVILTSDRDGAQGRPSVTTDASGLPWVIYFHQPAGGTPNAVEAIRNFIIPRSTAELEALLDAAGEGTPTP